MNAQSGAYLTAMGIPVWRLRDKNGTGREWKELISRVERCTLCPLHGSRGRTVFGTGNRSAQWLIVGEAPGMQEDRQGEPFVGRAGMLLNEMLRALGYSRDDVFIANTLKCRPPKNRDPLPVEARACAPFLERQIELLSPRVILAVGRIAAQLLLERETSLSSMRGKRFVYRDTGIPVAVTYHPAYLLRKPADKAKAWADLKFARSLVREGA